MTINSYLLDSSSNLLLSVDEKNSIITSINTLESRLDSYFGNDLKDKFEFGSYPRVTILPRKVDDDSDVDYMIVFNNSNNYKPQTFLDRLRKFAETKYSTSQIYQSFPTIVLELNHIKFELVPAYSSWGTYYIPDGNGNWMSTYPKDFNAKLTEANNNNYYKVKPIIRLIKHWNVNINYANLTSYKIEEKIANAMHYNCYSCTSYSDYLTKAFNEIKTLTYDTTILNRIDKALSYENDGMPYSALSEIKKVIPEV